MNIITTRVVGLLILCIFVASGPTLSGQGKWLVYTKNGKGYVHDNIATTEKVLTELGEQAGFQVDVSSDPTIMTDENLKEYHIIIFSNTNNETFDTDDQKLAFQRYIQAGGGFVGIHSASGSERQWPWFWKVLGGKFKRHPPLQPFKIHKIKEHPSVESLPDIWEWEDECYYLDHLNPEIEVLLAADLSTIEDEKKIEYPGTVFGNYFPITWCHRYSGGKQWYTALGHKAEYYHNKQFQQLLMDGIRWAMVSPDQLDYSKSTYLLE